MSTPESIINAAAIGKALMTHFWTPQPPGCYPCVMDASPWNY